MAGQGRGSENSTMIWSKLYGFQRFGGSPWAQKSVLARLIQTTDMEIFSSEKLAIVATVEVVIRP